MDTSKQRRQVAQRRIRDARAMATRFLEQRKRELEQDLARRSADLTQERRPSVA